MLKLKLFFIIIFLFFQSNLAFSETIRYININHIMNKSKAGIDIIEQLNKNKPWHDKTVKTLINHLEKRR